MRITQPNHRRNFVDSEQFKEALARALPQHCRVPSTWAATGALLHSILDKVAVSTGGGGPSSAPSNTKGYSSTYLAMGFANVRAGTWYKRVLEYLSRYGIR